MLTKTQSLSLADLNAQERIAAGTIALLIGVFLLYGVGFAHSDILHNAAHDTRHAIAIPCH